jgi:hypothetical protein
MKLIAESSSQRIMLKLLQVHFSVGQHSVAMN